MANVEKISVSMTTQHADLLRNAVASGAYASGSEVIREALREWQQRRGNIATLKAMWEEGKASGEATEVDFDELRDEARKQLTSVKPHAR